jgi:hypothetical protein
VTSSYSANIVVNVQNQKSLERTAATVGRLNSLIKQLKPINLLAPGSGSGADAVRTAMTEVIKKAKLANNSIAGISATFAGASSQASAFSEILANVKIDKLEAGKTLLKSQNAEVQELASAFAKAEGKAGELQKRYQGLLQAARQAEGLAIGPATELGTLEAELQKRTYYEKQITEEKRKQERLDKEAIASARSRRRDAARRSETRRRDILTGAGFPLLFGGGPLQALAGGIGGAVGGLGGSIAASAITAQVEAFAKEAAKVGQALNSTGGALELVREKSLFSSEQIKERAFQLEEQGRVEELAALLTGELTQLIGNEGVRSLQELGETTSETTKLWNQLTTQLFALVSGPLEAFLKVVNQVLGAVAGAGSREAFFGDLGSQEGAARSRFKVLTGESLGTGRSGSKARAEARSAGQVFLSQEDALAQIRKEFKPVSPVSIPVTAQDRRDFSVSGGRAKKGRESRLPQLQAEVALQERLAVLSRQVVKAKEEENPVREAALNMEIALEKQATAIEKINLKKIPPLEKEEEIKKAGLAADREIFSIQDKLNASKAAQAEKAAETLKGLQSEQDLLQARLDGRLEEEQLEQKVNKIMKENEGLTREQVEQSLQGTAALKEQVKALENLESMYASIGQSISSGIVDALSAAVEGTKSLADVASQTLRQVANILLQFGVNTALGGIPGLGSFFGGGRAAGGPVSGGTPYMVGEKGPELFVPNTSGNIVPNNKLGGGGGGSTSVVVNVDAKGSSASGDSGAGKQLGGLIGAAVQAELIKQQRPGGLLSR